MDAKTELITEVKKLGYPVILQGSLAKDEPYPDTFFTFWEADSNDWSHYDNTATGYVRTFSLFVYSTDPEKVNTLLLTAKNNLQSIGWISSGVGSDAASDEPTHTGRYITVYRIQK